MKFTCDSCGAQYLIADEKIGPRGVKVRCKKCSHVIILRPDVLAARDPMEGVTERPSNGHKPQTGGSASSVPVAPSVAAASRGGLAEDVLAAATSSDMGLSQEFRALGFDDGERAKPRAATLSVGLDLSHAAGVSGETSPFAVERTGGSLDLVPPEPGPGDRTAVDSLMVHPFGDERTELLNEAKTDDSALPTGDLNWGAGLGTSALADDGEEPSTRVENLEGLARASTELEDEQDDVDQEDEDTQAGESPLGSFDLAPSVDVSTAPLPQVRDEDDAAGDDDALDELAAMRASLDADMAGISADMSAFDGADDGPQTVVAPHPEEEAGLARSLADLSPGEALAAAEAAHPFTTAPDQPLGASMPELGIPPGEEDSIAEEIGSAFAAMFGGEGGEEQDPLSALTSALADDDSVNKAETRVFDTEAMAKVEAEQDRALGVDAGEAPEPKEWYVAIDEEQVGPLTRAEVAEHVEAGRLEPGSLCWRAGMGDWSALRSVAPLADLVAAPVAAPVAALAEDEDDAVTVGGAPSPSSSELLAAEPPRIEPEPEPVPPPPEPEPAWRPSAASLLASLAAEELSSAPAPAAEAPSPSASMAPLGAAPVGLAASDALEKLLEGEGDKSAAAQFGAAEKSESYVRPLPRRADTVSSLPLRDPTADKQRSNLGLYILGGFALLGVFVLGGMALFRNPTPELKTPEGALASAGTAPTLANAPGLVTPPVDPPQDSLRPAPTTPDPAAAPAAAGTPDGPATPPTAAAMVAAPPPAEVAPPPAAPDPDPVVEDKPKRTRPSRKERRTTTRRESPPPPTRVEEPPPPPPAEKPKTVEDDLLGVAKTRRVAPEPKRGLPDKLDDSDVLGVLRSNRGDVQRCLKAQTAADPTLEGTMTVELVIRSSGRTKDVRVRPDKFRRTAVGECMVGAVKKWTFPQFAGASMPLDFPVRVRAQ